MELRLRPFLRLAIEFRVEGELVKNRNIINLWNLWHLHPLALCSLESKSLTSPRFQSLHALEFHSLNANLNDKKIILINMERF